MYRLFVSLAIAICSGCAAQAQEPKPQERETKPQWQRMLTGEDAKKAEELEKQINKSEDIATARKLCEELRQLRARIQGADHWQTIDVRIALKRLALAELSDEKTAQLTKARELALKAVNHFQNGKYAEALPLTRDSWLIYKSILGSDHPDTIMGLNVLGRILMFEGNHQEAEQNLLSAHDDLVKSFGSKHPFIVNSLIVLGQFYRDLARYSEAESVTIQAISIGKDLYGEESARFGVLLESLAKVYYRQGKLADSSRLYAQALHIWQFDAPEGSTIAGALNVLGEIQLQQGKYLESLDLFKQAAQVQAEQAAENDELLITIKSNLGVLSLQLRKYDEAELLLVEVLQFSERRFGSSHSRTLKSKSNLAGLYVIQRKSKDALQLLKDVRDIRLEKLGEQHPETLSSIANLAAAFDAFGQSAEAEAQYKRALDGTRNVFGEYHPSTLGILNNLATMYWARGDYQGAETLLLACVRGHEVDRLFRARGIDRSVSYGPGHYDSLAAVSAALNKPREALAALEFDLGRGLLDETLERKAARAASPAPKEWIESARRLTDVESQLFRLISKPRRNETEQQELDRLITERRSQEALLAERSAAESRAAVADLATIQAAIPADGAMLYWLDISTTEGRGQEHWACVVRRQGAPQWVRLPGSGSNGKWTEEDQQLTEELRKALQGPGELAKIETLISQVKAQRIEPIRTHIEGVKRLFVVGVNKMAGLPVELLAPQFQIEYVTSGTAVARAAAKPKFAGVANILAIGDPVFPMANQLEEVELPPGGVFVVNVVAGGAAEHVVKAGDVLLSYGDSKLTDVESLSAAIIANFLKKTVPVQLWRVTPDGQAITKTVDLTTGRLGVNIAKEPAREALAARQKRNSIVAATNRSGHFDPYTGETKPWRELPGTAVELDRLQKAFGNRATIFTRSAANEQRLDALRQADKLKDYSFLHFATHGLANNYKAFESILVLSQDQLPKFEAAADATRYDGELSAREILNGWNLNADLVTLSACETGLGTSGGGDGLLGFSQAFLLAGARSVCLTLWEVDDTATFLLMDRFYQNLLGARLGLREPMPKSAALREAKAWLRNLTADEVLKLSADMTESVSRGKGENLPPVVSKSLASKGDRQLKPYADPRYWSAFILIGDPD